MNLDQINTFLDLVESRNFNRTADRLNLNQSTISSRIRALEDAIGARLFVRGRGGAELTPEGERFESYARNLRLGWNLARQEVGMPAGFTSRLRVAMQVQLSERLIDDWGMALREALPNTAIHIGTEYSRVMTDQVVFGNLDIAVIYNPEHRPELQIDHAFDEMFLMVATKPRHIDEVKPAEYILIIESAFFQARHAELLPQLQQPGLSVQIGTMALSCLRRGNGVAYLPQRLADPLVASGELHWVEDAPRLHQPVHIAYHVRNRDAPNVTAAIRLLRNTDINAEPTMDKRSL